jgi:hypothetical protein
VRWAAVLLVPALAVAEPRPPQQQAPPQIAVGAGVVGRWVFAEGACTTSTNWTFRPDGTGEAQQIEFRYTRVQGVRYHLTWNGIEQDYDLVVDGDRMTSYLRNSEERVCLWKRTS